MTETRIIGYRNCLWCNQITSIPHRRKDKKFCSKKCYNEYEKKYYIEKLRERGRKFYWKNIDRNRKKRKEYYWKNREKMLKQHSESRKKNKANILKKEQKWRDENREKLRKGYKTYGENRSKKPDYKFKERIRHRKYRRQENGKKWTKEYNAKPETKFRKLIWVLKNRSNTSISISQKDFYKRYIQTKKCEYCGILYKNLTIDHIVPVVKKGTNDINNLAFVCSKCNASKKDKDIIEWAKEKNIELSNEILKRIKTYKKTAKKTNMEEIK